MVKHGDWRNYSQFDIHKAVCDEFQEYSDAVIAGDIHGPHGQRRELLQVAVTALKGWLVLGIKKR